MICSLTCTKTSVASPMQNTSTHRQNSTSLCLHKTSNDSALPKRKLTPPSHHGNRHHHCITKLYETITVTVHSLALPLQHPTKPMHYNHYSARLRRHHTRSNLTSPSPSLTFPRPYDNKQSMTFAQPHRYKTSPHETIAKKYLTTPLLYLA